jgi:hypothetical protein
VSRRVHRLKPVPVLLLLGRTGFAAQFVARVENQSELVIFFDHTGWSVRVLENGEAFAIGRLRSATR